MEIQFYFTMIVVDSLHIDVVKDDSPVVYLKVNTHNKL